MNATAQTAAWLDILPALPLARGVPVRVERHTTTALCLHHGPHGWVLHDGSHALGPIYETSIRVDLDDPQGFGYALRLWWLERGTDAPERIRRLYDERMLGLTKARQAGLKVAAAVTWSRWEPLGALLRKLETGMLALTLRHLRGQTTDADRLALARALAEVS